MGWVSSEQNNLRLSTVYMEAQASGAVCCNGLESDVSVVKEANLE